MPATSQIGLRLKTALAAALLAVVVLAACSKPAEFQSNSDSGSDAHKLPFHQESANASSAPTQPAALTDNLDSKPLPFNSPLGTLPAGTLLTVRLVNSLSGTKSIIPANFTAVVVDPVIVDGLIVIPRGSAVTGRVEAANASGEPGHGFVRLTLNSVSLQTQSSPLPIRTSSLFARGNIRQASTDGATTELTRQSDPFVPAREGGVVDLNKGRRLTFRLTDEVSLPGPGF